MDCLLPVVWRRFKFFIVTPRMFTFSLEYVENARLIAAMIPKKEKWPADIWGSNPEP